MPLGRSLVTDGQELAPERPELTAVNSRVSLWPGRWPAIALDACIQAVEEAPPQARAEVKRNLPCKTCEKNTACLTAKQKETGPLLYGREFLTSPRAQEASLFPRSLMEPMLDRSRACVPHYLPAEGRERIEVVASAYDLAYSEKIGGDYFCKITGVLHLRTGQRRVIDVRRWSALTFQQQCESIVSQWGLYHDRAVVIESDAAQVVWSQTVEASSGVPVLRHAAGNEKKSLTIGVPSLLIEFSNRKWSFPYRDGTRGFDEVEELLIELGAFGFNDGRLEGVGEHDDLVMALWHLSWAFRMLSGSMGEFRLGVTSGRTP